MLSKTSTFTRVIQETGDIRTLNFA